MPCITNFQSISSLFRDNQSHGEFLYQLPLSPASNLITVPGFLFCFAVVSTQVPSVAHLGCLTSVSWTTGCQQQTQRSRLSSCQAALVSTLYGVWTDSTGVAVNALQILSVTYSVHTGESDIHLRISPLTNWNKTRSVPFCVNWFPDKIRLKRNGVDHSSTYTSWLSHVYTLFIEGGT